MGNWQRSLKAELKHWEDQKVEAERNIEHLALRMKALESLPFNCPSCKASGEERYTDAAGSGDWRDCRTCRGLGRIGPIKCECGHTIGIDMISVRRENSPKCPWCGAGLGDQYGRWY